MMDDQKALLGVLTGYRCKSCGGSLYINYRFNSWCSQCTRGGDDLQPLDLNGPYIPVESVESKIIATLRAKLAEVERERDEFKRAHIAQVEYTHDLIIAYEAERDEARKAASAWKRSAKMWRHFAYLLDYRGCIGRYLYFKAKRSTQPPPF